MELISHDLWWNGPEWLYLDSSEWPEQCFPSNSPVMEADKVCLHVEVLEPLVSLEDYSCFSHLKRITAWVRWFVHDCQHKNFRIVSFLSVAELAEAEAYWLVVRQQARFATDVDALKQNQVVSKSSPLLPFRPFLDESNLLSSKLYYQSKHPAIIDDKHLLTKLIIKSEHVQLLHAAPTLLAASLSRRFHILGGRRVIQSVTRSCITCQRISAKPQPP